MSCTVVSGHSNTVGVCFGGDNSLAVCLRFLSSIRFFISDEHYASHHVLSELKSKGPDFCISVILSFDSNQP